MLAVDPRLAFGPSMPGIVALRSVENFREFILSTLATFSVSFSVPATEYPAKEKLIGWTMTRVHIIRSPGFQFDSFGYVCDQNPVEPERIRSPALDSIARRLEGSPTPTCQARVLFKEADSLGLALITKVAQRGRLIQRRRGRVDCDVRLEPISKTQVYSFVVKVKAIIG